MAENHKSRKINMRNYDSNFNIFVYIPLTNEKFAINDIQPSTKISCIKKRLELITGIPMILQRLFYLDKDDLLDSSDLRSNDVVLSAILTLHIWSKWQKIVFNSFIGNQNEILKSKTTGLDMGKEDIYQQLLNISLFVSANKGRWKFMETLINEGANVNWATTLGRTALHAAAAQGQTRCIDLLLEHGANAGLLDFIGKTPAMIANEYGHRISEKQLFLFQWQKRANRLTLKKDTSSLMMHQQFDSGYCTWLKGKTQQVYLCNTLPVSEFIGTGIDAPRQKSLKSDIASNPRQVFGGASSETKDTNDVGLSLPKVSESPMSGSTSKQSKETHQQWLSRKKGEGKARIVLHQKDERKMKKGGRDAKLSEDQRAHLKYLKRSPILTDKPKKRTEIYNDYDVIPVFEQSFLRAMETPLSQFLS